MSRQTDHQRHPAERTSEALGVVSDALARLRYGVIQLTVHDGRVQQIEVTEKRRLAD